MGRVLGSRTGAVVAAVLAVLVVTGAVLGLIATRQRGVAVRPSPTPAVSVPAGTPTPSPSPTSTPAPTATATSAPAPRPTSTPTPGPACADPAVTWSLARRLAQLLIVGGQFSNLAASTPAASAGAGAFVFFGQPAAGSGPAIRSGLAVLASAGAAGGGVAPWMSTDEEGGLVQRLANVVGPLPSPRQMAAQWSAAQVRSALAAHAASMRALGITMDLAPVLDTASPSNPVADEGDRSFSENGQVAAAYGLAFADGLLAGGVVPVGKHFPGFGHADANTDLGPATDPPLSRLVSNDLVPFEAAIAAGQPVIMVSHVAVPGLSGTAPASLTAAIYDYLRDTLGFDGVAMTDSLEAGAISAAGYSEPAAAVAAVEAGADMVMVGASSWPATLDALEQAVASGALPLFRVNASVDRILAAKGFAICGS